MEGLKPADGVIQPQQTVCHRAASPSETAQEGFILRDPLSIWPLGAVLHIVSCFSHGKPSRREENISIFTPSGYKQETHE